MRYQYGLGQRNFARNPYLRTPDYTQPPTGGYIPNRNAPAGYWHGFHPEWNYDFQTGSYLPPVVNTPADGMNNGLGTVAGTVNVGYDVLDDFDGFDPNDAADTENTATTPSVAESYGYHTVNDQVYSFDPSKAGKYGLTALGLTANPVVAAIAAAYGGINNTGVSINSNIAASADQAATDMGAVDSDVDVAGYSDDPNQLGHQSIESQLGTGLGNITSSTLSDIAEDIATNQAAAAAALEADKAEMEAIDAAIADQAEQEAQDSIDAAMADIASFSGGDDGGGGTGDGGGGVGDAGEGGTSGSDGGVGGPGPDGGGWARGGEIEASNIAQGAIAALLGNHPDPVAAIEKFIKRFGKKAFTELRNRVLAGKSSDRRMQQGLGGEIRGAGTGTSDSIPGKITTQGGQPVEDIRVSDGEYILPETTKEALNRNFGGVPGTTDALDQYVQLTNGAAPRKGM